MALELRDGSQVLFKKISKKLQTSCQYVSGSLTKFMSSGLSGCMTAAFELTPISEGVDADRSSLYSFRSFTKAVFICTKAKRSPMHTRLPVEKSFQKIIIK
jgi:hypothetical protein